MTEFDLPSDASDLKQLILELRAHQIELEVQNKQLNVALKEKEEALQRYNEPYEFAPVGYLILDPDGIICAINQAGSAILGMDTCLALGGSLPGSLIAAEYRDVFNNILSSVFSQTGKISKTVLLEREEGDKIWVRIEAMADLSKAQCHLVIVDITDEKQAEEALTRINETLLHLGPDHQKNIGNLTRICGELLSADYILYNKIQGDLLCVIMQWNSPVGLNICDAPEGHFCYDIIKMDGYNPFVVSNLSTSVYAKTDPNVAAYGLKTYLGHPVRYGGITKGSLCAAYTRDHKPTFEELRIIGILSTAIAQEEERKETHLELAESEERFRKLLQNVPSVAVQGYGMDGITQYWNQASQHLYGYTADEAIGKNLLDLIIPPEMRADVEGAIAYMASTGESIPAAELLLMRKDGSRVFVYSSHAIVKRAGYPTELFCIDIDLSHLKRVENELRESERKFRDLFNNAGDAIMIHDLHGRVLEVNDVLCTRLGYSHDELLEMNPWDIDEPEYGKLVCGRICEIQHNEHIVFETVHCTRDGVKIPTEVNSRIITYDGQPAILSTARDITERKHIENALKQANRNLNLMTSITRHDILNQVNVLLLVLDIVRDNGDKIRINECIKKFESAITNIQSQISFTRVYERLGSQDPCWVSVRRILLREHTPDTITYDVDVEEIEIFADPLFERVFFNLLDNSMRHGQTVSHIRISSHECSDEMTLIFEDDGVGIPACEKEKIFDRGHGKNTGLGLFFITEILSITGMTIKETGEEGRGARFEIVVPKGGYRLGKGVK